MKKKQTNVIKLRKDESLTTPIQKWLDSNHSMSRKLKYYIENTHAVYEIGRIIEGNAYSMETVWDEAFEWYQQDLLSKKACNSY
jgi:hypothetical protein